MSTLRSFFLLLEGNVNLMTVFKHTGDISGRCMGLDVGLCNGLTLLKNKIEKLDAGGP